MTLAEFEGEWRIARMIRDRLAKRTGRFDGSAVLHADGDGLAYSERGLLRFPGNPPLEAVRCCLWRQAGKRISVLFQDGRPFHDFTPKGVSTAEHSCPPDSYAVLYDFSRWPQWSSEWTVSGPRKDYSMVTRYVR